MAGQEKPLAGQEEPYKIVFINKNPLEGPSWSANSPFWPANGPFWPAKGFFINKNYLLLLFRLG